MRLSRLNFIKGSVFLAASLLFLMSLPKKIFCASGSIKRGRRWRSMKRGSTIVSVRKCSSYEPDQVYDAVKAGLSEIGFVIKKRSSVLVKPNILAQNTPDQCATTHPAVVDAVCRLFSENNCSITIGESSAFYQGGGTREGFVTSGIGSVASKYGARLLPFEATHLRGISSGTALNPFYITEAVFEHDLVINIPKMKVHRLARYTGAIKNVYGCIPGGAKQLYHKQFQHRTDYKEYWGIPLVDVYEAVKPGLNILDAVWGLDEDGPAANGKPRFTGLLLLSKNAAALDVTACRIMGFDPEWVPAVREAVRRGLVSVDDIAVKGELPLIPYVKLPDEKPKSGLSKKLDDYMFDQLIVEPLLDSEKCDNCGICIRDCTVHAIARGNGGYPEFDLNRCIRCYCCSEYCPRGAIYLHGGIINHIIRGVRTVIKI